MKLAIFDIDGCLISSFMASPLPVDASAEDKAEHYARVDILPGRRERLAELREQGVRIALATNQGGVACGYQTLLQVESKLRRVVAELGLGDSLVPLSAIVGAAGEYRVGSDCSVHVAYAHPNPRLDAWRPRAPAAAFWRKPGPGLLLQAMIRHRAAPADTLFVGDMASDEAAAIAAGIRFVHADLYFAGRDRNVRPTHVPYGCDPEEPDA